MYMADFLTVGQLRDLLASQPDDAVVTVECEHSSGIEFAHPVYADLSASGMHNGVATFVLVQDNVTQAREFGL